MSEINEPIGVGTTTLDYLFYKYPWLKSHIAARDVEIEGLKQKVYLLEDQLTALQSYIKVLENKFTKV